jgi:hypothetical protein
VPGGRIYCTQHRYSHRPLTQPLAAKNSVTFGFAKYVPFDFINGYVLPSCPEGTIVTNVTEVTADKTSVSFKTNMDNGAIARLVWNINATQADVHDEDVGHDCEGEWEDDGYDDEINYVRKVVFNGLRHNMELFCNIPFFPVLSA